VSHIPKDLDDLGRLHGEEAVRDAKRSARPAASAGSPEGEDEAQSQSGRTIANGLKATGNKNATQTPFPFTFAAEITGPNDASDFVEGLLVDGTVSVLYGDSNVGKSFFAIDLACHVACKTQWRGREVDPGGVLYIALEGEGGIHNRLVAWRRKHDVLNDIPLAIVSVPVWLMDPIHAERLALTVEAAGEQIRQKFGLPMRLVVIDTLARTMVGGNENAAEDMGKIVASADTIKTRTGCHVMFIHHSGKEASKGARGSSALRAAVDTEIEVRAVKGGGSIATCNKQRDFQKSAEFPFELEVMEIGKNRRGKPITSCTCVPWEDGNVCREKPLSPTNKLALDELEAEIKTAGRWLRGHAHVPSTASVVTLEGWRLRCYSAGITEGKSESAKRQAFKRVKDALVAAKKIKIREDYVWQL